MRRRLTLNHLVLVRIQVRQLLKPPAKHRKIKWPRPFDLAPWQQRGSNPLGSSLFATFAAAYPSRPNCGGILRRRASPAVLARFPIPGCPPWRPRPPPACSVGRGSRCPSSRRCSRVPTSPALFLDERPCRAAGLRKCVGGRGTLFWGARLSAGTAGRRDK